MTLQKKTKTKKVINVPCLIHNPGKLLISIFKKQRKFRFQRFRFISYFFSQCHLGLFLKKMYNKTNSRDIVSTERVKNRIDNDSHERDVTSARAHVPVVSDKIICGVAYRGKYGRSMVGSISNKHFDNQLPCV